MAFIDWLYGTSAWKLGLVVSAIVVGSTLILLLLADRVWQREHRRDHNDIAGFLIAVVGVVFAILVSSLALTVLTRQDRAQSLVLQEVEIVAAIEHESGLLPSALKAEIHKDVLAYLQAVTYSEWPEMRQAKAPAAARPQLGVLWRDVVALPVETVAQAFVAQTLRQQLDRLAEVRRGRSELATIGVDRVIWTVVLFGSAATILFAVLFGVRNVIAHMLMTGLLAFVIALAITMIIAIDWPYFGQDSVGPAPLIDLRDQLA